MTINICVLSNKREEIGNLVDKIVPDIVFLNETKLSKDVKMQYCKEKDLNWTFLHEDAKENGHCCGGIAVGVSRDLRNACSVDKLDVKIPILKLEFEDFLIFGCYAAPTRWTNLEFFDTISRVRQYSNLTSKPYMLIGDLNARIGNLPGDMCMNTRGRLLQDEFLMKNYFQLAGNVESRGTVPLSEGIYLRV